jgi:hypothetical protein
VVRERLSSGPVGPLRSQSQGNAWIFLPMTGLSTSARLYARVAFLRHRVLLQHAANRAAVIALGILLILVGFGLLNAALFLYLRTSLGDIGAVLTAACLHFLIGALALLVSWQEHDSPELQALAESEAAALKEFDTEATNAVENLETVGHRLAHIGSNVTVALTAISSLQALLARTADRTTHQSVHESDLFDQQPEDGRRTHEPASHPR